MKDDWSNSPSHTCNQFSRDWGINCIPFLVYSLLELFQVSWQRTSLLDPALEDIPKVFNWVKIRWLCGPRKWPDPPLNLPILNQTSSMAWCTVILKPETWSPALHFLPKWIKVTFKSVDVLLTVHSPINHYYRPQFVQAKTGPHHYSSSTMLHSRCNAVLMKAFKFCSSDPSTTWPLPQFNSALIGPNNTLPILQRPSSATTTPH